MGVLGWTPQQWCFSCLATNLKTCSLVEAKWWLAFRLDLLFLFVFHTYIQTLLHKWKFTLFFEQLPLLLPFQRDKLKLKDLLHSHMAVSEILENPIPMDSLTFPSFCNAIEVSSSYKELLAAFSSFFLKTLNLQSFFLVIMENSTSGRKWATGGGKELLFSYPQALKKLCQQGLICSWDLTVVAIKKEKKKTIRNSRAEAFLSSGEKSWVLWWEVGCWFFSPTVTRLTAFLSLGLCVDIWRPARKEDNQ